MCCGAPSFASVAVRYRSELSDTESEPHRTRYLVCLFNAGRAELRIE